MLAILEFTARDAFTYGAVRAAVKRKADEAVLLVLSENGLRDRPVVRGHGKVWVRLARLEVVVEFVCTLEESAQTGGRGVVCYSDVQ